MCAAYHLDDTVRLSTVPTALSSLSAGSQLVTPITTELAATADVAHAGVTVRERGTSHQAHVFVFSSGAVVFWHVPGSLRKRLLQALKPGTAAAPRVRMRDFDHEFGVTVGDGAGAARFRDDRVVLTRGTTARELLALSYGLAQSVELVILEASVDQLAARTRALPECLAAAGRVGTAVTPLIGELLAARYRLSLVSDIWDVPEYFWTNPDLEPLYADAANAVELRQRAHVLDARVAVIRDALDMVNGEIRAQASNRVERAILALIAVEVVLEVAKLGAA